MSGSEFAVTSRHREDPGASSRRLARIRYTSICPGTLAIALLGTAAEPKRHVCLDLHGDCGPHVRESRGVQLHEACWNGVRCFRRLCMTDESRSEQSKFWRVGLAWRADILPLNGNSNGSTLQASAKRKIEEMKSFIGAGAVQGPLLLTKPRFYVGVKREEGIGDGSASEECEARVAEQSDDHCDGECLRVKVSDNVRLRDIRGERMHTTFIDDPGIRRQQQQEQQHQLHSSPAPSSARAYNFVIVPMPTPMKIMTTGQASQGSSSDGFDSQSGAVQGDVSRRRGTRPIFLHPEELKIECDGIWGKHHSKHGIIFNVQNGLDKMTPERKKDIERTPFGVGAKDTLSKFDKHRGNLEMLKMGGLRDAEKKLAALTKELDGKTSLADEAHEGIKFVLDQDAEVERKQILHARYLRQEILDVVVGRGFPKSYAKHIAAWAPPNSRIVASYLVQTHPEAFNPAHISMWAKQGGFSSLFWKELLDNVHEGNERIAEKQSNLLNTLGKLGIDDGELGISPEFLDKQGSLACAFACWLTFPLQASSNLPESDDKALQLFKAREFAEVPPVVFGGSCAPSRRRRPV